MSEASIILVDDEQDFVETLAKRLNRRGYDVEYAFNGEHALEILKNRTFDVAIIDFKMPGMNGLETLIEIKKMDPSVQVIFLTGHASTETGEAGIRKGAFDYMTKPVEFPELISKITAALENKNAH